MMKKRFITLAVVIGMASATCPPVEEGKSYSIQCSKQKTHEKLNWELTSLSGNTQLLNAACNEQSNPSCTVPFNDSLDLTNHIHDYGRSSTLKFNKVTKEHRNLNVQCIGVNSETGSREVITACRLEVYLKPKTPICRAEKHGDNRILVTCLTAQVHPGLKCLVVQRETKTNRITNIKSRIEYKNVPQSNGYSVSSCSALISYLPPGSYQYFAVLAPDISTYVRNYSVPVDATRPIEISLTPQEVKIFIESPTCAEAASGDIVVCETRGFNSMTSVYLYIGDVLVQVVDSSVEHGMNGGVYRSRFSVPAKTKRSDNILCVANSIENTVTNQTTVEAVFTARNSYDIQLSSSSGDLILSNNRCLLRFPADTSTELICSLGDAPDLTVEMRCVNEKETLMKTSSNAISVNIIIENTADYHEADCQCIARHADGGVRQKKFFRIITISDSESIVNIAVPVVISGIVLLCLAICTVYCWIKRRNTCRYYKVKSDNNEDLKKNENIV